MSLPVSLPIVELTGRAFVKIIHPGDESLVLRHDQRLRPPARFNRQGENALYLSPDELSARVAIGQYVQPTSRNRCLVRFQVSSCRLVDLRHPENADLYDHAGQPWLPALDQNSTPASWHAADRIRNMAVDGLIDPSRRRPGLWHVTLFRWNDGTGPDVSPTGLPEPIKLTLNFR